MRNLRTLLGALALLVTLGLNSGCTIMLWNAALDGEPRTIAPAQVVSAWIDGERTLHLGVRFADGEVVEQRIRAQDLTPRGIEPEAAVAADARAGRPARAPSQEPVRIEEAPTLPEAGDGPAPPDARGAAWLVRREVVAGEVLALDLVERRELTAYIPPRSVDDPKMPMAAAILLTPLTVVADVALVGCLVVLVLSLDDDEDD